MDITLLDENELENWGILKDKGIEAPETDLVKLVSPTEQGYNYWTKSRFYYGTAYSGYDKIVQTVFSTYGCTTPKYPDESFGIRPVISNVPALFIDWLINRENGIDGVIYTNNGSFIEPEYGYYPQDTVPVSLELQLEEYKNYLRKTGNTYTIYDINSNLQTLEEYEYHNRKFVRTEVKTDDIDGITLSNGRKYYNGDSAWIEVKPVKWFYDCLKDRMVTEKILCYSKFDNDREYNKNFEDTMIKKFMDEHLLHDLIQNYSESFEKPLFDDSFKDKEKVKELKKQR